MNKALTIESIHQQYKDVWVVVEVTRRDRYNVPAAGSVLFHGSHKEKVYENGFQFGKENPETELYLFYTGELAPENMAVMLGTL